VNRAIVQLERDPRIIDLKLVGINHWGKS